MSERQRGLSGPRTSGLYNMACPADRGAGCSLRAASVDVGSRRDGWKKSLTECEIKIFLSLAPGHHIAVKDHETGGLWHGHVDMTFPEQGFVWSITNFGERKLLDIGVHTVWRPDEPEACGSSRRKAAGGTGQLGAAIESRKNQ